MFRLVRRLGATRKPSPDGDLCAKQTPVCEGFEGQASSDIPTWHSLQRDLRVCSRSWQEWLDYYLRLFSLGMPHSAAYCRDQALVRSACVIASERPASVSHQQASLLLECVTNDSAAIADLGCRVQEQLGLDLSASSATWQRGSLDGSIAEDRVRGRDVLLVGPGPDPELVPALTQAHCVVMLKYFGQQEDGNLSLPDISYYSRSTWSVVKQVLRDGGPRLAELPDVLVAPKRQKPFEEIAEGRVASCRARPPAALGSALLGTRAAYDLLRLAPRRLAIVGMNGYRTSQVYRSSEAVLRETLTPDRRRNDPLGMKAQLDHDPLATHAAIRNLLADRRVVASQQLRSFGAMSTVQYLSEMVMRRSGPAD